MDLLCMLLINNSSAKFVYLLDDNNTFTYEKDKVLWHVFLLSIF